MKVHHEEEFLLHLGLINRVQVMPSSSCRNLNLSENLQTLAVHQLQRAVGIEIGKYLLAALVRDPSLGSNAGTLMQGSVAQGTILTYSGEN